MAKRYDAEQLQRTFLSCADIEPNSRILDLGWGGSPLFVETDLRGAQICFVGDDIRQVRKCEKAGIRALHVPSPAQVEGVFNGVFYHPEGHAAKGQVFHWVDMAFEKLDLQGVLYFAGQKDRGVLSYVKYLEQVFGRVERIGRSGRMQYFKAIKKDPQSGRPPTATDHVIDGTALQGGHYQFVTHDGVFSRDGIDTGSRLLLEQVSIASDAQVLDVGCGYGLLGIVCAKLAPKGQVWMTDVSARAISCAKVNMARNGVNNASAHVADLYEGVPETPLDLILSNPPFHEGNKTAWPLIDGAYERLKPNGALMLVVMRAGPYIKRMEAVFGSVDVCVEQAGFTVLRAYCKK